MFSLCVCFKLIHWKCNQLLKYSINIYLNFFLSCNNQIQTLQICYAFAWNAYTTRSTLKKTPQAILPFIKTKNQIYHTLFWCIHHLSLLEQHLNGENRITQQIGKLPVDVNILDVWEEFQISDKQTGFSREKIILPNPIKKTKTNNNALVQKNGEIIQLISNYTIWSLKIKNERFTKMQ